MPSNAVSQSRGPSTDWTSDHPSLQEALAADRAASTALMDQLKAAGRGAHPAIDVLDRIVSEEHSEDDIIEIAAIAFETGIRVHWGAIAGPSVQEDGPMNADALAIPASLITTRAPYPWEPEEKGDLPHFNINWREAVARGARDFGSGNLEVSASVPGCALVTALIEVLGGREPTAKALVGDAPRDPALDPVSAGGTFLCQVIPGFIDLDLELRQRRERVLLAMDEGPLEP